MSGWKRITVSGILKIIGLVKGKRKGGGWKLEKKREKKSEEEGRWG